MVVLLALCMPLRVQPQQRSPEKSPPAEIYFKDIAVEAGLTAPMVSGGETTKTYIIEGVGGRLRDRAV